MNEKSLHVTVLAMSCWLMLSDGPSHAATVGASGPDVVPVVLIGEPKATGYIQPVCSKCKRLTVERRTTSTGGIQGTLELTYYDEVHDVFDGAIVLTLHSSDDSEHVVTIDDVHLVEDQTAWWSIDAGSQWSWVDVDMVWVEFLPED
jgi:hypothetical protein